MRVVAAIGGNALIQRGEKPDAAVQLGHLRQAALALAPLTRHELIIVPGDGPQVGLLALESEADPNLSRSYPLDVLVAETQGMIGYGLAQELGNAGASRPAVTLLTRTVVDGSHPDFAHPTKFIGPSYPADAVPASVRARDWTLAPDGPALRRVVPSPPPVRIPELDTVELLLAAGRTVICGTGGGSAVIEHSDGLVGVEAVVDKDLVAAQLAIDLGADRLILLTDVAGVFDHFRTRRQKLRRRISTTELAKLALPDGSMGPKVYAAGRFTAVTGRPSAIGALVEAGPVLAGRGGTQVHLDVHPAELARAEAGAD